MVEVDSNALALIIVEQVLIEMSLSLIIIKAVSPLSDKIFYSNT